MMLGIKLILLSTAKGRVSNDKLRDYDLWSMRMEQYLTHTDYALWEVIVNGDAPAIVASASTGAEGPIPPKTHLLKLHACKDANSLWEAIKNRFGGNKESKKMQKTILKQNYENFAASSQEGLDKTYDRSLPSAWNNIALIMRNKSDLDTLSMDDLFYNLKVYESDIKGKSSLSLISQNVAFVASDNSSSTNETVNTASSVSAASFKDQASTTSYVNDVMFSFFANQFNAPQLDYKDLEQINTNDLEEMDLKWQVAMLTMRVKRFIKKTGKKMDLNDKETVSFDRTKVECYNCHRRGHFARECRAPRNQENRNRDAPKRNAPVDTSTTNALVVQDGIGYRMRLESFEARIVVHEKNEAVYEEDIAFLKKENVEDSPVNDRYKTDDSVYKTKVSETKTSISKTSKDIVEKPKTVMPSAPIIEEWDTNSDNDSVFRPKSDQTKPKFTKINFVKSGENVKSVNKENTHRQVEYPRKSQSPRDNRRNWNDIMT
ncbi:ribonuclease H-like domain-containing protein [Tanacetum coccineum]